MSGCCFCFFPFFFLVCVFESEMNPRSNLMLQQFGYTSASQEWEVIGLRRGKKGGFLVHLVFHTFVFCFAFFFLFENFFVLFRFFFFPHPTNESCLGLGVLRSTFHKQEFYGSEEVTSGRPSALLGVKRTLTLHSDRSFPDTPNPHGSRTGIDPGKETEGKRNQRNRWMCLTPVWLQMNTRLYGRIWAETGSGRSKFPYYIYIKQKYLHIYCNYISIKFIFNIYHLQYKTC